MTGVPDILNELDDTSNGVDEILFYGASDVVSDEAAVDLTTCL